jgi:site-specific recombinase XerD
VRYQVRYRDHAGTVHTETGHDLRVTTWARLRTTMAQQVLPRFGTTPLVKITNAAVRAWVAEMLDAGYSAATIRKAVFALRRCLAAAMADRRIMSNPAADVPLPPERAKTPRFLSQTEVERLAVEVPTGTGRWSLSVRTRGSAGVRRSALLAARSTLSVRASWSGPRRSKWTGRSPRTTSPRPSGPSVRCPLRARLCDGWRDT